jgi:quercetin dioxygenase-like cupin family protein
MRIHRILVTAAATAALGAAIGFGLGSAVGQQSQQTPGLDNQLLATVDAGENCPGHVLRMRRGTIAPGTSIPMHSHKTHPEVSLIMEGTLTNTLKGQPPIELPAGTPVLNGPEVEHSPANRTAKPVVVLSIDLIKKE